MPYIYDHEAEGLFDGSDLPWDAPSSADDSWVPNNVGELTFMLTNYCVDYLQAHGVSFARLAEVSAALRATAFEIERRVQAPYEMEKAHEPGRVDPIERLAEITPVKQLP